MNLRSPPLSETLTTWTVVLDVGAAAVEDTMVPQSVVGEAAAEL